MIKIPRLRMSFYGNGRFAFNVHICTSIKNATAPTKGKVAFL